jgi:hypothetical protein
MTSRDFLSSDGFAAELYLHLDVIYRELETMMAIVIINNNRNDKEGVMLISRIRSLECALGKNI